MFGAGRPSKKPEVLRVQELTLDDLKSFTPATTANETIKKLRDSHHRIAHLFAAGLRPFEIAEITGYSVVRLSTLRAAPAMVDLIEVYRKGVVEARQGEIDEHFTQITRARNLSMGELVNRLEEAPDDFTNTQLLAIAADGSDRTGYPKRSVALNVNMDFAAKLDAAVKRSNQAKVIEGELAHPRLTQQTAAYGGGEGEAEHSPSAALVPPPHLRRRA